MEKNVVIIDLVRYEELIEAEKKSKEPKKHTIITCNNWRSKIEVITDDDATAELANKLAEKNTLLQENSLKLYDLTKENDRLKIRKWWQIIFK
jgi:hypothetical protein